jgi:hypothetical protein
MGFGGAVREGSFRKLRVAEAVGDELAVQLCCTKQCREKTASKYFNKAQIICI